jgi:rod shape determining protein RodA
MKIFKFENFNKELFYPVLFLVLLGLTLNYSFGNKMLFLKQLSFTFIGFLIFFFLSKIDFRILKSIGYLIYFLSIIFLILVLIFGKTFRGVKGWLSLGIFSFQVVEFAKLALIIVLALFWQKTVRPLPFKKVILSFLFVLGPIILLAKQPDFGSALILFFIWLGMFLIVDRDLKHLLIVFLFIILSLILSYFFVLKPYQRERLLVYLNPNYDPLGRGYQIKQAITSIGSGGFWGQGLTFGLEILKYLPASQTDFIFSALAFELGFLGCFLVFILYFFLFRSLIKIIKETYDNFGALLLVGISVNLLTHFVFNIGMNLGLLPIIGIPLPFLSYGGSSLIINFILLGLAESVSIYRV